MQLNHSKTLKLRFLFFWILSVLLESPLLYSFFDPAFYTFPQTQISNLFFLHILSATALFFSYPKFESWFHYSRNWSLFFFFIVLFLPVFGHITCLCTYFFCTDDPNTDLLFEEDAVFMTRNKYKSMLLDIQSSNWFNRAQHAVDFVPLVDILEGDDEDLKRGAIERIIEMPPKNATELLKKYSSDDSPEVRFHVTSALAKIKRRLEDDIEGLKLQFQNDMANLQTRMNLVRSYLRYCDSGMLDQRGTELYIFEAINHLKQIISQSPHDAEAHTLLLKILIEHHLWNNALEHLKNINDDAIISTTEKLKISAECHFNLGDHVQMMRALIQIPNKTELDQNWTATINWLGAAS